MRYRIMVVGNTRAITESVARTLRKNNQIVFSSMIIEEFENVYKKENPDIVVICLKTVTMEQIAQLVNRNDEMDLLKNEMLVIGDEKERLLFQVVAIRFQPIEWSIERDLNGIQHKIDEVMRLNPKYEELYNRRILIIEDDMRSAMFLKELISEEYDVLTCENAIESINILTKRKIDGVMLSHELASMPGRQLYLKIRGMKGFENVPIFFITSNRSKEVIMDCVGLKPQGLFIKPLQKQDILELLHKIYDAL